MEKMDVRTAGAEDSTSDCFHGLCTICGGSEMYFFQCIGDHTLLICGGCRHISWSAMPTADKLREYYETRYTTDHRQLEIQRRNKKYYLRHLRELLTIADRNPEDVVIADYGCSFPVLLEAASTLGFRKTIGIEHDHGACKYGSDRGIDMFQPGAFPRNVPNDSIDIFRFSHSLEHLRTPMEDLLIAHGKMRKGGLIHITQPSYPPFAVEPCGEVLRDVHWPEHLHYFSSFSLVAAVQRAGFKVIRFFTHQNADSEIARFTPYIDYEFATRALSDVEELGDLHFGRLNNYPVFCGENSVLYAVKEIGVL
jgi:hypothetical protein